jgi:hypothetical protein
LAREKPLCPPGQFTCPSETNVVWTAGHDGCHINIPPGAVCVDRHLSLPEVFPTRAKFGGSGFSFLLRGWYIFLQMPSFTVSKAYLIDSTIGQKL